MGKAGEKEISMAIQCIPQRADALELPPFKGSPVSATQILSKIEPKKRKSLGINECSSISPLYHPNNAAWLCSLISLLP